MNATKIRVPLEEIRLRLPEYIKLDETTYAGTSQKARFVDDKYGEFWSRPKDVFKGHDHRNRANEKISLSKMGSLIDLENKLPSFLTIKKDSYKGLNKKAVFVDSVYGDFISTPKDILRGRRHRNRSVVEVDNIKLNVDELKARLPKHVTLVDYTYLNAMTRCSFVDDIYGRFEATPNGVIKNHKNHPDRAKENRKKNCLLKFGVEHPSQNREVILKIKRNSKKIYKKNHWETGEELLCCGGYESKVVDYLNENKIKFKWQIPFKLDVGVYWVDLYLEHNDVYVEIKGWWRQQISKDKWEEFHKTYPNSELWNQPKLKDLGIL